MDTKSRNLDHLYIHGYAQTLDFHPQARGKRRIRPVDRFGHGTALRSSLEETFNDFDSVRHTEDLLIDEELRATGTIIVLEGKDASYPLRLDSLSSYTQGSNRSPKWLLLSVQEASDATPEKATIWVADDYRQDFLKIFEDYLDSTKETTNGHPLNRELVQNISRIRRAVLDDLWTSSTALPTSGTHWWELWLDAKNPQVSNWRKITDCFGLKPLRRELRLADHLIIWVQTTQEIINTLLFTALPITEIRHPEFIDTVEDLPLNEQREYVEDLSDRITPAHSRAPSVCHLDTGVRRTHVLLEHSLATTDHHSIFGNSGDDVHSQGHGTSMAGLALYGNLDPLLTGSSDIFLRHGLESVRIFPSEYEQAHDPRDYGTATAEAISRPEATRPDRSRAFCLTVSAEPDKPGEPTLWSAAVDALSIGTDISRNGDQIQLLGTPDPEAARLIVVAAGNVFSYIDDYRANSIASPIQDPAQAWNALTVGAFTELAQLPSDPAYAGWRPLGTPGDISPHTTTSTSFDMKRWPIKPDICMEGGNVLSDGNNLYEVRHSLLSLRSTGLGSNTALTSANATSAATAQAARLAALAMERYPSYWPETIRGLLPHAAEWTTVMRQRLDQAGGKNDRHTLLRQFGWGIPSEQAVLNSASSAVTLVTQDAFQPFSGPQYRMRDFRFHSLPWPMDVLQDLGASNVRLRITLSYFIEPSASRRGWRNKYAYASHGLRFDLQHPRETQDEFINRINREEKSEDNGSQQNTTVRWFLGPQARHHGSLHQDEWEGTGAELAQCRSVAVYPVGGWWKNNHRKDRQDLEVRYALLLSLYTDEQGIDLYTPIATQLEIPVTTEIVI